ncbi:MAG: hypothetical protein RLY64_1200, partial [Bacteroidota bacterium]
VPVWVAVTFAADQVSLVPLEIEYFPSLVGAKKLIVVAMITPPAITIAIFLNKFISIGLMFQR